MESVSKVFKVFGLEITGDSSTGICRKDVAILLSLLIGLTVFNYIYNGLFRPLSTSEPDFEAYYNASLAFKHGFPLYEHIIRFFNEGPNIYKGPMPYVYPPCFVLFLSPLAYLSFKQAALVWLLLNHVLFFAGLILLMKAMSRKYSFYQWVTLIFVCMNFTPLFVDYLIGQSNIILFFFLSSGLYFYRSNRDIYAGIALAMAVIIKVIPMLLVVYMLWKRNYKVFSSAILAVLFICIYSLLFFDIELYSWYVKFMVEQTLLDASHDNNSLTGFFSRMLIHSPWTTGVFHNPGVLRLCIRLSCGFMLLLFLYVTRKKIRRSDPLVLHEYGLGIITMLLVSKMTTTPYLVMMLVPISILVNELFKYKDVNKWVSLLGMAYGVLAVWYPLPVGNYLDINIYKIYMRGFHANIFSIQFFALIVFWCYFAFASAPIQSDQSECELSDENSLDTDQ